MENTIVYSVSENVSGMRDYPDMAQGAVRNISYDWTKFLRDRGTSVTVTSCTMEADPTGSLTFSAVSTSGNITTTTVTVPDSARLGEYQIKWTATLSNSEVEPKSVPMTVVEHKER